MVPLLLEDEDAEEVHHGGVLRDEETPTSTIDNSSCSRRRSGHIASSTLLHLCELSGCVGVALLRPRMVATVGCCCIERPKFYSPTRYRFSCQSQCLVYRVRIPVYLRRYLRCYSTSTMCVENEFLYVQFVTRVVRILHTYSEMKSHSRTPTHIALHRYCTASDSVEGVFE